MKFGVVVFPGSNCDHDAWYAVSHNLGQQAEFIWHDSQSLGDVDAVILPGGFSYGDYLRCGAIAKFSPVMRAVKRVRRRWRPGARHLQRFPDPGRSGLLPGALVRNAELKFICRTVAAASGNHQTRRSRTKPRRARCSSFPSRTAKAAISRTSRRSTSSKREDRVVLRYLDNHERIAAEYRGNLNEGRNVMGMMPHPERAADPLLVATDGLVILNSMVSAYATHTAANFRPSPMSTITADVIAAHQLTESEYDKILSLLGREPTLTELGIFSVMWSEHCSYKSSRIHLKKLPTESKRVLQGPGENAGIIDIGDGIAIAFKIESHNHPSFIEPFQGAATGVGGILRDIFTMGARPIAVLDCAALRAARTIRRRARATAGFSKAWSPASRITATVSACRPSAASACSKSATTAIRW